MISANLSVRHLRYSFLVLNLPCACSVPFHHAPVVFSFHHVSTFTVPSSLVVALMLYPLKQLVSVFILFVLSLVIT